MEIDHLNSVLSEFLKTDPAVIQTIACLSSSAEIAITVAGSQELRVRNRNGDVVVDYNVTKKPDFTFSATTSAIDILVSQKSLTPGQLGVQLAKQVVSREIQIKVHQGILKITSKGYLNILKLGGSEFFAELKSYGLTSPAKIIAILKNLKKNS